MIQYDAVPQYEARGIFQRDVRKKNHVCLTEINASKLES